VVGVVIAGMKRLNSGQDDLWGGFDTEKTKQEAEIAAL
jgi:hypothetical protein